ncbi:MAG: hypothetical protein WCP17_03560 [bacterium]
MEQNKLQSVLGLLRISMGLIFLWAFFDKLLGLGFATTAEKAWLAGGSPTSGFLQFGVNGPFADFFHSLSSMPMVDWLFMLGLLFVGLTLTFGILVKLGSLAGAAMLFLMYIALIWGTPRNHPFIDDHFIYFFVMLTLMLSDSGDSFGFGNAWSHTSIVQKFSFLK